MRAGTRRWTLVGGALGATVLVVAGVVTLWPTEPDSAPTPAPTTANGVAERFLTTFAAGKAQEAAELTDDPAAAGPALAELRSGPQPQLVTVVITEPATPSPEATEARVKANYGWNLGSRGTWAYSGSVELRRTGDKWLVRWTPTVVHPKLAPGQRLALKDTDGKPTLVDRDGNAPADDFAPVVLPGVRRHLGVGKGARSWRIVTVDGAGTEVETLEGKESASRQNVLTLGTATQNAAQNAVNHTSLPAMAVAIQPSTGEILAVAQNAAVPGTRALNGLYPPGSTFKIATAAAALANGASTATRLPCPGSSRVAGRPVRNDGGFDLGEVTLSKAFAASCNTSFAQLMTTLPDNALREAAASLGVGVDFTVPGVTTLTGKVPGGDGSSQAENGFGQGTVLATPFGMAVMAATVARGSLPTPVLVRGETTGVEGKRKAPSKAVIDSLRSMMREVVTGGTATALSRFGAVRGKTGTAQFGDGTSSHGWFVGYRDDLAFAVLVENGESSSVAITVTADFLGALR
ncbi:penicillin-binding transpeptidase domain-containing protein [Allokutzneria oryzae]|uniref:Penicillin-binding transpeptidase domain-containing protein n=1 Tax=Allokutzneria oryzae TaxID=1378989 RepID=A0ABV5ZRG3_9PSEU